MEQQLAYSFHLGSDKNKSKLAKKVSKGNVSGTTSLSNNTIHFDETSPHMHIAGVPIIENCTRGMKKQVGYFKRGY